ncbi:hypothetical protein [Rosenbergiella nectarea]|nr:hypothetical protein [Rosenbergiella nectarea]
MKSLSWRAWFLPLVGRGFHRSAVTLLCCQRVSNLVAGGVERVSVQLLAL